MKKTVAIITMIIGLIVMIMGFSIETNDVPTHIHSSYNVYGAAFGADFYTYVYDGIDTIVDELDDINSGVSKIVRGEQAIADTVATVGKNIVIAIGLLIIVSGLKQLAYASKSTHVIVDALPPREKPSPFTHDFNSAPVDGWKCSCGKIHSDFLLACSCGLTKDDVLNSKQVATIENVSDYIICKNCSTKQKSGRTVCFYCGSNFVDTASTESTEE